MYGKKKYTRNIVTEQGKGVEKNTKTVSGNKNNTVKVVAV